MPKNFVKFILVFQVFDVARKKKNLHVHEHGAPLTMDFTTREDEWELLNIDLRHQKAKLEPVLPRIHQGNYTIAVQMRLQVISCRDVSRPTVERLDLSDETTMSPSENAPKRLLRFQLSDGNTEVTAVEFQPCSQLKLRLLCPGTKLLLRGEIEVENFMILLRPRNVVVLGGIVPHLMQKWQVTTSKLDPFLMSVGNSGKPPPPFVEFDVNKIVKAVTTSVVGSTANSRTQSVLKKPLALSTSATPAAAATDPAAPPSPAAAAAAFPATSTVQSCRATNMFMDEDSINVARLVFELQIDGSQKNIQASTSNSLMLILLGLNAKGAPPLAKLWKSKKGKKYLNERVDKLKIALMKKSSSFTMQKNGQDDLRTIVNIA